MTALAIVFSSILYLLGFICIPFRIIAAPACSFLGLLILSFSHNDAGYPLLPVGSSLIFGWLCVTVLVTVVTLIQPAPVRDARKGMGYIFIGALTGLAIGLLGFTITNSIGALYAIMVICTAAGTFLGYLIFTNTPDGRRVRAGSGNFFSYLLAKGFPTAITVMQAGVVLVLLIAMHTLIN
ncbi:MAG: hypothetical protein J1E95_02960 [Muribaculaceae bacterium]|nr:hypothetical protein [Muribaculaceae bacterium]